MNNIDDINYSLLDSSKGATNVTKKESTLIFKYPCVSTIVCTPYVVHIPRGVYRMSLWGAQGGSSRTWNDETFLEDTGGRGAFVSGKINIHHESKFYFYVGGKGEDLRLKDTNIFGRGGFNGGGNGGYDVGEEFGESNSGGGGASDIRLIGEDNIEGYKSRIIVAGAGGSRIAINNIVKQTITDDKGVSYTTSSISGDAGTLEGFTTNDFAIPGKQTSGCFGKGNNGVNVDHIITDAGGSIGGGGGGYYGGDHIDMNTIGRVYKIEVSGAGGSSFVSGCRGCNAVSKHPIGQVVHTNQRIHYSGYSFFNIVMKSGKDQFKTPYGISETGHHGNGFISITYISKIKPLTCFCKKHQSTGLISIIILVYMS